MSQKWRTDEGFTLIEMLIVVLILGIVGTIAVVGVSGAFKSSKQTACQTDVQSIDNSMSAYYNDNPTTNPDADESNLYAGVQATNPSNTLVGMHYLTPFDSNPNYSLKLDLLSLPSASSTVAPTYQIEVLNSSKQSLPNYYARDNNGGLWTKASAASPWVQATSTNINACKGV
jgi:prepilin-type N-terminal cleavage/methylation domain-containing protein